MLYIIGGAPERFVPYVDVYHRSLSQLDKPRQPVGVHSPGHIAKTDEQAREEMWPHYRDMFGRIGRERGWAPITKEHYLSEVQHGSLYVGSPETVAKKIAHTISALGLSRFLLKYSTGLMAHEVLLRSIEMYGTQVIPMVRDILTSPLPSGAGTKL
jgi:alkanesulfonate monooxygenase SsuD/methylene tetrahydromethanopterin reductase-like flavin-dependent oxidoreductase (luciferase family)